MNYTNIKGLEEQKSKKDYLNKAKERFSYKSIVKRFKYIYVLSNISKYLFHLISILTGFYFLYNIFNNVFSFQILSIILAALILVVFEGVKAFIITDTVESFYSKNHYYTLALFSVIFMCGSVYSSLNGTKELHSNLNTKLSDLEALQKLEIDSLNSYFLLKIQENYKELKEYKKQVSYRGQINIHNKTNKQIISNYDARIDNLERQQLQDLNDIKQKHKRQSLKASQKVQFNSNIIIILSFINEVTIILIYWFIVYFDFMQVKENELIEDFAPNYNFSYEDVKHITNSIILDNLNKSNSILLNKKEEEKRIGFKPPESVKVLNSYEETRKNVLKDIESGLRDYRTLCKKHHTNVITIKKIFDSIK